MKLIRIISEHKKPNRKHPVISGCKRVQAVVLEGRHVFTAHVDIDAQHIIKGCRWFYKSDKKHGAKSKSEKGSITRTASGRQLVGAM
jgi:hypothetical protein